MNLLLLYRFLNEEPKREQNHQATLLRSICSKYKKTAHQTQSFVWWSPIWARIKGYFPHPKHSLDGARILSPKFYCKIQLTVPKFADLRTVKHFFWAWPNHFTAIYPHFMPTALADAPPPPLPSASELTWSSDSFEALTQTWGEFWHWYFRRVWMNAPLPRAIYSDELDCIELCLDYSCVWCAMTTCLLQEEWNIIL